MPSPNERPRLCLIGDSHLGSVRLAETGGLVDFSSYEVEYWGAACPSFRGLMLQDDRMVVRGADAQEDFARINGTGRTSVGPQDFDEFLLFGCRVSSSKFFGRYFQWKYGAKGWQSRAVLMRSAHIFLASSRVYWMGVIFAQKYGAKVSCIPESLITANVVDHTRPGYFLDKHPDSVNATAEDRAWLWNVLVTAAAEDGVTLIPQPDETVVGGVFTDPCFARDGAFENEDADHKSPEFAEIMLGQWNASVLPGREAMRA